MSSGAEHALLTEWEELEKEYLNLEEDHKLYQTKIDEMKKSQDVCSKGISHQKYRIKQILESVKKAEASSKNAEDLAKLKEIQKKATNRKNQFREMEDILPHKNGVYLSIILGEVNVSLLSKQDKFTYKQEYEKFKLVCTVITLVWAICLLTFLAGYRWFDAAFDFLLVWYYCTLTIREHILKVNGSRIKGWWVLHHFVSTVCAGIILIWPESDSFRKFRDQFMYFSIYLALIQIMQFYYQTGALYRLRALGERHSMDISVEGFQSWMWRGLTYLLPFLFGAYLFQLYNAYVLYQLSHDPKCEEWQVYVLAIIFLVLFAGNTLTLLGVVKKKLSKEGINIKYLRSKYNDMTQKAE
ncbi:unnamed protein product [Owenia fusiformis]|uniref:Uncharacterized protein n=1 Tax=Owenia fusiformis TaxID=6347 RepID=A0A8J1TLK0_OWEFU|nr:unnamed protein product [Owenia fusiformis]